MELVPLEQEMLAGLHGRAAKKAMEILSALGVIYGARRSVPVSSVQIAGVSYDNLGEAGLEFLTEMAQGGAQVRVLTTLNPAGMDIENPDVLGIDPIFAQNQRRVIETFEKMGVKPTCTCTPYLVGNKPGFGEHIAWAESSAVCYANSVLGARTNREGGPSALAAAITGHTPEYGYHLSQERRPTLKVEVNARLVNTSDFGALGQAIGSRLESFESRRVPFITGLDEAAGVSLENLKSFCASIATFGGVALFHMQGITPEAFQFFPPEQKITIQEADLASARNSMSNTSEQEVDFVSLGCPHLTIEEIARIAKLLQGNQVQREFWITTARPTKQIADRLGYTEIIEASGAKFATDTCCVVAPIRNRFKGLASDSAKACYYAASKNRFKTFLLPFDEVVALAIREPQSSPQVKQTP